MFNKVFKHVVGKSTLKEGITIHKGFEDIFASPDTGQKKEITILYGNGQSVNAVLRRLNNIRKHVHIKYTSKAQVPFVEWLNATFTATKNGAIGEFLEFQKVSTDVFKVSPITLGMGYNASLYVADSVFHKINQDTMKAEGSLVEIEKIVNSIGFKADEGQSYYNRLIEKAFLANEWQKEIRAIPDLDLKCDYRKMAIQVEVEFGNARAYYQDYIKFMLSYSSKQINLGILITPTLGFANVLCEIGKQKALQRGRKTYSGMMHFEKAFKEFQFLKAFFDMPIAILGIDISPL